MAMLRISRSDFGIGHGKQRLYQSLHGLTAPGSWIGIWIFAKAEQVGDNIGHSTLSHIAKAGGIETTCLRPRVCVFKPSSNR